MHAENILPSLVGLPASEREEWLAVQVDALSVYYDIYSIHRVLSTLLGMVVRRKAAALRKKGE